MSKKNKQNNTQREKKIGLINNRMYLEDLNACKKLLVFYMHQKTDHLSSAEKINYSKQHIFPLNKKIDLYYDADKINNQNINDTYARLRSIIINANSQNIDDYFQMLALIEILLILYHNKVTLDDETLIELVAFFAYETNISLEYINEYLNEAKKVLKPIN